MSQVPGCVINAISNYMTRSYVQLSAGYAASNTATRTVHDAHDVVKVLMNAAGAGEVVLGPSTSQLVDNIARSYATALASSDTIIVHEASHEANAGPWVKLGKATGSQLLLWKVEPGEKQCCLPGQWICTMTQPICSIWSC
jgi:selenocysteine lyase/cysteine desulfurase